LFIHVAEPNQLVNKPHLKKFLNRKKRRFSQKERLHSIRKVDTEKKPYLSNDSEQNDNNFDRNMSNGSSYPKWNLLKEYNFFSKYLAQPKEVKLHEDENTPLE
jgi:hypothetical protein